MGARDDYPEPAGMHPAQHGQMCDEIDLLRVGVRGEIERISVELDRLRAEVERLQAFYDAESGSA